MSLTQDFGVFWNCYPRRVGKIAAAKAYERARRSGVTQEQLLDGVERYILNKPAYADWAHPKTWLTQGRWDDEYAPRQLVGQAPVYSGDDWWQECQRLHNGTCNGHWGHITQLKVDRLRMEARNKANA